MLEVQCPRREPLFHSEGVDLQTTKMPVDFEAYLLSASPPGFDMYHHFSGAPGFGGLTNRLGIHQPKSIIVNGNGTCVMSSAKITRASSESKLCSFEDQKYGDEELKHHNSADDFSILDCEKPKNGVKILISSTPRNGKLKKKVSFADDLGFSLEKVRIIKESPDMPPRLRPEILSTITIGATAGVTEKPPLVLQFPQPASDYLKFRENVEKNCVSLENVILKDYNLIGTIRVKNIAFEKSVHVRCTFDGWETDTDIVANYVPNNPVAGHSSSASRYDTFKFEMSVPPTMDFSKKIQFCVCYETSGTQFWDNNNGANYEVTAANWKERDDSIFTINYERDWTSYSCWSAKDSSVPYY